MPKHILNDRIMDGHWFSRKIAGKIAEKMIPTKICCNTCRDVDAELPLGVERAIRYIQSANIFLQWNIYHTLDFRFLLLSGSHVKANPSSDLCISLLFIHSNSNKKFFWLANNYVE